MPDYNKATAAKKTAGGAVSAGLSSGIGFLIIGLLVDTGVLEVALDKVIVYGAILTGAINGAVEYVKDLVTWIKNRDKANV